MQDEKHNPRGNAVHAMSIASASTATSMSQQQTKIAKQKAVDSACRCTCKTEGLNEDEETEEEEASEQEEANDEAEDTGKLKRQTLRRQKRQCLVIQLKSLRRRRTL